MSPPSDATTEAEEDRAPVTSGSQDAPQDIPAKGWKAVGKRAFKRIKREHVVLNAAGVAFFGFLAAIPALIALVTVYGLVGDPDTVEQRVDDFAGALPTEVRDLFVQQLESITTTAGGALTIGLIVSLAAALWSASSGMSHLVEAVSLAYREDEQRGFVSRRALSLALTLGGVFFAIVAIAAIAALPAVLGAVDLPGWARWAINIAVWPVVGLALAAGLAVLYRFAPDREDDPGWRWFSPGAVLAVVAWVVASIGFQIYVANFGNYNETYGSLGAIVVALLWLFITSLVILVGALVNCEVEREAPIDLRDDEPNRAARRPRERADARS